MKDSLVIILYDHPLEHTADYVSQACNYLKNDNIVIGFLLKDAVSIKEIILKQQKKWFFKKASNNYYLVKPIYIIPFRRFEIVVKINIILNILFASLVTFILLFNKQIKSRYLWIYNPEQYFITVMFGLAYRKIYDCVDYHGTSNSQAEKKLIIASDWVFVNSNTLYKLHQKIRPDVQLVPLGFDLKTFSQKNIRSVPRMPQGNPVVGYVGGINSRLDYMLLTKIVKSNPDINFIFLGPFQRHEKDAVFKKNVKPKIDLLFREKNSFYYPSQEKILIPLIIKHFDICIIPYDIKLKFNKYAFPMKLFEYFYMGKPVVSTEIAELKKFPKLVRIAEAPGQWSKEINNLLKSSWSRENIKKQKRYARQNSWDNKFSKMTNIIISQSDQ
ncbi:hypothetical protein ACFL1A_00880 [Patescibacteria group bacterium]